jgi:antitoxin component YwqK of YwqJK toxin-antitoxin module
LSYGSYQDGELRGLWQEYYESGPTKTEGNYQQGGVKFGMWLSYYEDKSKHREDGYMYGKRHGHLKVYGLDGSLLDMDLYENGVCTAECEADD